jgi:1-acyl-sn-glycerol-3-phosphate acyltransferase
MGHVRALARLLAIVAYSGGMYLFGWLGARALTALSPRRGPAARRRVLQTWAAGLRWVVGMRVVVSGSAPRPPFVLVTNHLSYLDPVLIWAAADCMFLAKSEVARWPVLGYLTRAVGVVFVDREQRTDVPRALRALHDVLNSGHGVVFFPEGTSSGGASVLPFRASFFELAAQTGLPVHCAALAYRTGPGLPDASASVCWWGDMSFFSHFYTLLRLPHFDASLRFAPEPVVGADRKQLAQRAHGTVLDLLEQRAAVAHFP